MTGPAERAVAAEYVFDRAGEQLLAQAYRVLVPEKQAQKRRDHDDEDQLRTGSGAPGDERPALGA
jgi:hypothetical protein